MVDFAKTLPKKWIIFQLFFTMLSINYLQRHFNAIHGVV